MGKIYIKEARVKFNLPGYLLTLIGDNFQRQLIVSSYNELEAILQELSDANWYWDDMKCP